MHARIQGLVDIFPRDNVLIDIGSDHGYLGLELLKLGKTSHVVNVDLSQDALIRSEETYKKEGFKDKAQFVLSDGFTKLSNYFPNTVVVIAGLGSIQILKILEHIPQELSRLIILSHTDYFPIRKWAFDNSWFIKEEKYIIDSKEHVYLIVDLVKGKNIPESSNIEFVFGREEFIQKHEDLFISYWKAKSERILRIPTEYRSKEENLTIEFLKNKKIIDRS